MKDQIKVILPFIATIIAVKIIGQKILTSFIYKDLNDLFIKDVTKEEMSEFYGRSKT